MCHTRQARHHHAEGHPAGEEDTRRLGRRRVGVTVGPGTGRSFGVWDFWGFGGFWGGFLCVVWVWREGGALVALVARHIHNRCSDAVLGVGWGLGLSFPWAWLKRMERGWSVG